MGLESSTLLTHWPPQVNSQLKQLVGWSRQTLCELFEDLRMLPHMSMNFADFYRLLRFRTRELAEPIFALFEPVDHRVPYLSIIGPMVVMSDQHYISRVSLLFSMFDFNSQGLLNRAEFFIAARSLLRGCAIFWQEFSLPAHAEVERMAMSLFSSIDGDKSELITMGEFLTFAYRSRLFRMLMSPFSSTRTTIYEEPVHFAGRGVALEMSEKRVAKQLEKKLQHQIRLTPDPIEDPKRLRKSLLESRQRRQWRQPRDLTRAHAWVALQVFHHLSKGDRLLDAGELLQTLTDDLRAAAAVEEAVKLSARDLQELSGQANRQDAPEGVSKVLQQFCLLFGGGHVRTRVASLRNDGACKGLSLRAFCCVIWPRVPEMDMETLLGWCKGYQAHRTLIELMKVLKQEDLELDAEDIDELFDALDRNHDGLLTVDELHKQGHLDINSARRLVEKLATDRMHGISKAEVRAVVQQMDQAFREQFRAIFAASKAAAEIH